MIDHKYRVIFIHQRKVAGISIAQTWEYTKKGIDDISTDFHRFNDGVLSWDWNARTEGERSYFIFSAIRNPFDRLISSWKFLESTRHRTLLDVLQNLPRQ